jgi:hypothetical protein
MASGGISSSGGRPTQRWNATRAVLCCCRMSAVSSSEMPRAPASASTSWLLPAAEDSRARDASSSSWAWCSMSVASFSDSPA